MKKLFFYAFPFLFLFCTVASAQIENRAIDGNWKSVRMKLVKDEFKPYYVYFSESEEEALHATIKAGQIAFDKEFNGFQSKMVYTICLTDEKSFQNTAVFTIVRSDKHHIVIEVPQNKEGSNGQSGKTAVYQIAFERD